MHPCPQLLQGVDEVIASQDRYLQAQVARNQVALVRGRGVLARRQSHRGAAAGWNAKRAARAPHHSGHRFEPRHVSSIEVDHEYVLDSDSILSLPYLPRSLIVLGSGVIACEYASIFAALGCAVTMVDKAAEPLGSWISLCARDFWMPCARWAANIEAARKSKERASMDSRRLKCCSRAATP